MINVGAILGNTIKYFNVDLILGIISVLFEFEFNFETYKYCFSELLEIIYEF